MCVQICEHGVYIKSYAYVCTHIEACMYAHMFRFSFMCKENTVKPSKDLKPKITGDHISTLHKLSYNNFHKHYIRNLTAEYL